MNVIGVAGDCAHNSAVALIRDEELTYAEAEERLSRRKGDGGFPRLALAEASARVGEGPCTLAGAGRADDPESAEFSQHLTEAAARTGSRLVWIDHHLAHARCAAYTASFDDGAVVTADGQGNGVTTTYWRLHRGELERRWQADLDDGSLGFFFAAITEYLGYRRLHDEGKVCALAAVGRWNPELAALMSQVVQVDASEPEPRLTVARDAVGPWELGHPLIKPDFAHALVPFAPADVALAAQEAVEEAVLKLLTVLCAKDKPKNIAVAGGLFANVRINWRLAELPGVHRIAVTPPMGDDGLALGAAVEVARRDGRPPRPPVTMYLGSGDAIAAAVDHPAFDCLLASPDEIVDTVTRLLAEGEVVARCVGRGEFGPRALGNRSLLYRPDDTSAGDWLNRRLGRDAVMPFAPCVRQESLTNVTPVDPARFGGLREMTVAVPVTRAFWRACPGVVHVDGTARIQAVDRALSPQLWQILKEFERRTGLPALINTSLNRHREPICRTLDDAFACADAARFDFVLAGDDRLYYRKGRKPNRGV